MITHIPQACNVQRADFIHQRLSSAIGIARGYDLATQGFLLFILHRQIPTLSTGALSNIPGGLFNLRARRREGLGGVRVPWHRNIPEGGVSLVKGRHTAGATGTINRSTGGRFGG
jgi:hypothetical protein